MVLGFCWLREHHAAETGALMNHLSARDLSVGLLVVSKHGIQPG